MRSPIRSAGAVLIPVLAAVMQVHAAVVTNFVLHSDLLSKDYNVSMAVPDAYADSTLKYYPVLYCLHGSGAPYTTYTSMGPLKNDIDSKYPMLVVTYGSSGYAGDIPFFFEELIPYIESNFRVLTDSTKRALTGFSMGGDGSFRFMEHKPGYFSSVTTLSAAFQSATIAGVDAMAAQGKPFPGLMMDCGTADTWLYSSQNMHAQLTGLGIPHIYGETLGSAHDWTYWQMMSDSCAAVAWRYFDDVPPLAPTGLQAVPTENTVTLTWTAPAPASDKDVAKMYAVHRNGTPVDTVPGTSFTDIGLASETAFTYAVYSIDDAYLPSASAAQVTVTTAVDANAPVVLSAMSWGLDAVRIDFDEAVTQASAENAANYSFDKGVTATGALLSAPRTVIVSTSYQTDGTGYTVSIGGVADRSAAGNAISPAQQVSFTARATFYDDFENGLSGAWGPDAAGWSVLADGGSDVLHMAPDAPILRLDRNYGTFTLDARVRAEDASSYRHAKIVFGYADDSNYYDVDFGAVRHGSYNGIFRTAAGSATKIGGLDAEGVLTDYTAYYRIRVKVDADAKTCRAFCGDTLVPVFTADIPAYAGGRIGLWTNRGKMASFDDVVITQYLRDGSWAAYGLPDPGPAGGFRFGNPAPMGQLLRAGLQVRTLQGTVPADGYRGIVIIRDRAGKTAGAAIVVE